MYIHAYKLLCSNYYAKIFYYILLSIVSSSVLLIIYLWRSEDGLQKFMLSIHHLDPKDQFRLAGLLAGVFTYLAISPALKQIFKRDFTRKLKVLVLFISDRNSLALVTFQRRAVPFDGNDIFMCLSDTQLGYISEEPGKEDNSSHLLLETVYYKTDSQSKSNNVHLN